MKVETSYSFPLVKAKGSHYDIGFHIGMKCKDMAKDMINNFKKEVCKEPNLNETLLQAKKYLPYALNFCPELVDEIRGYVEAAEIDFDEFFALYCYYSADLPIGDRKYGCTDIALSRDVTSDGCVYDAHNEDSSDGRFLCLVNAEPDDGPRFLSVTYGGLFPTIGFNSAGISITGNLLRSKDARIGVPKGFSVRKVLEAERIGQAIKYALPEKRASSYNQVVADANGELYSLEGSATDFEAIYGTQGWLVHTNHYMSDRMKKYEDNPDRIADSIARYNRAQKLVKKEIPKITSESLKTILSDHVNFPCSICRHENKKDPATGKIKTLFSAIINLSHRTMLICCGNPCLGKYKRYKLK